LCSPNTQNLSCLSAICWKWVWMSQSSFIIVIVVFHFTPIELHVVEWHLAILCLWNNEKKGQKSKWKENMSQSHSWKSKYFHNDKEMCLLLTTTSYQMRFLRYLHLLFYVLFSFQLICWFKVYSKLVYLSSFNPTPSWVESPPIKILPIAFKRELKPLMPELVWTLDY
jgi:hypothetical protein